jgi:ABC-2 type transport system permease protein
VFEIVRRPTRTNLEKERIMSTASLALTAAPSTNSFSRTLRIFIREARYEFLRLLRTRSFSLSVIGFPVVFYLFFGLMMNRGEHIGNVSVAKYLLSGYSVFGMVGASLFGVGVGLCSELAAAIPFACMGIALALLVPFNSAPGIANMIYLPMSFCGGLWVPIMFLPHFLQKIAVFLPTYHLGQLVLGALGFASAGTTSSHWFGLLGFTLVVLGIALIAFRRLEHNS